MRIVASLLAAFVLAGCAHSSAQQARSEVLSDGGTLIVLRYGPEDDEVARQAQTALRIAVPVAARWGALPPRLTVTIHPTHEALEGAARRDDRWLRAWARRDSIEVQSPRTWSTGGASDAQLAQLLAHELTHCVLFQALGKDARRGRGVPPLFWEGMATTNADERFPAALGSPPPTEGGSSTVLAVLGRAASPLVYATADHAFRVLLQRQGQGRIQQVLTRVRDGAEFAEAFHEVLGIRLEAFEEEVENSTIPERARD